MEIGLVRHGSPLIHRGTTGIANPSLDDYGRWQAERVSAWLAHEPIDAVITSPKARAMETIEPLVERLGIEPEIIADLDEMDRRSATYIPTDLLPTEGGELWEKLVAGKFEEVGYDPPDVFNARVKVAFEDLIENPRGEHVLVACHAGVIRAIMAAVVGEGASRFHISAEFASISRVTHGERGTRILSINETGHFDADRIARRGAMNTHSSLS